MITGEGCDKNSEAMAQLVRLEANQVEATELPHLPARHSLP